VSPVAPVLATDCFVVYSLRLPHRAFFRRFNLLILTSLIRFSFPHLLVIICAFSSSVHCHHLCIVIICALSSSVHCHHLCIFIICALSSSVHCHHLCRSTSLENHLERCRYNFDKTKEVKADPSKWEVSFEVYSVSSLCLFCLRCSYLKLVDSATSSFCCNNPYS
jgi:hypothetical protein